MSPRLSDAIERFTTIGEQDPRRVTWHGTEASRQLGEAACLWHYVQALDPEPSDAIAIAVHCQHLRRFAYPRQAFPEGRIGYLEWRKDAARRSAEEAAAILRELTFPESLVDQVVTIVTKRDRRRYRDVQTMEDALCLAFFRLDALEFAGKHELAEVERIVRRTWLKMSESGRAFALTEAYPAPLGDLLQGLSAEQASSPPTNDVR